jgi:hypothetical protein
MSNYLAIAAVTETLRSLLHQGVNAEVPTDVITRPPDRVSPSASGNQMNLFMYKTAPDGAWRNEPLPGLPQSYPPLSLVLSYLVIAYGADDDETTSHRLLGRAMSILHDQPLLDRQRIQASVPGTDLHEQVESVRMTPQPLSLDELSKLWMTFQTQYRISAAYEVSVVLIDSRRPVVTPLPVLTRGPDDSGVATQADTVPPFPTLSAVEPPNEQVVARLGDEVRLVGNRLGDTTLVRLTNRRLAAPFELPPPPLPLVSDTEVRATIPDDPAALPAGLYGLSAVLGDRTTNELPLAIAPRITSALPMTVARVGTTATVDLTCSPELLPAQPVALLVGDRQVAAEPHAIQTDASRFVIADARPGTFRIRLRVDGVESVLIDRSQTPPAFDETQELTVT